MVNMTLAPVLITVYDRVEHFKKTIDSLRLNILSVSTDLYVALDFPRNSDDKIIKEKQNEILKYLLSIDSTDFKSINVIKRDINYGAEKNTFSAVDELFSKYEYLIISEDDNVFSPFFLSYMNEGLKKYYYDENIYSICGYLEPVEINKNLGCDTFSRIGFTSNGFAVWKHKFPSVPLSNDLFFKKYLNPYRFFNMVSGLQYNVAAGLIVSRINKKDYFDLSFCWFLFYNNYRCIFPLQSLVRNIGQDGSGLNSGKNCYLQNQVIWLPDNALSHSTSDEINKSSNHILTKYHNKSLFHKTYRYFQYLYVSIFSL